MRKQLVIGLSVLALTGLGGASKNSVHERSQSATSKYIHFVRTCQNQTFEPLSWASLEIGLPIRNSFQTAGVHFITTAPTDEPNFEVRDRCLSAGYATEASSCSGDRLPGKVCPYDSSLVEGCYPPDTWCSKYGYSITVGSCSFPEFPQDKCPYNENMYSRCALDVEQACQTTGYNAQCESGYIQDEADVCSYDSSYKKCVCNPCDGYDYSFDEANEQGYHASSMFCNSCGEIKYKRVENNCDGYKLCEYGGSSLDVCWSGSTKYFKDCETNCENKCTLLTCPLGMYCEYESCTKKWCIIGCGNGKIDVDAFCKRPNTDCDSLGYRQNLTSCAGRFALGCPFDSTKYHCF